MNELFAFTGRYFDLAASLQYNRRRWYDPTLGQWPSEDPIEFEAGDWNLRRYVGKETIATSDPTGMIGENIEYLAASTYVFGQSFLRYFPKIVPSPQQQIIQWCDRGIKRDFRFDPGEDTGALDGIPGQNYLKRLLDHRALEITIWNNQVTSRAVNNNNRFLQTAIYSCPAGPFSSGGKFTVPSDSTPDLDPAAIFLGTYDVNWTASGTVYPNGSYDVTVIYSVIDEIDAKSFTELKEQFAAGGSAACFAAFEAGADVIYDKIAGAWFTVKSTVKYRITSGASPSKSWFWWFPK